MNKPPRQKKTKTSSTSNPLSSVKLENFAKMEKLNKDIVKLIDEYTGNRNNQAIYSDEVDDRRGFFLLWVKKDLDAPSGQEIEITNLQESMYTEEVVLCMKKVLQDMAEEQSKRPGIA